MHPTRLFRSTSFRLALGYAALFALSSLLLIGVLYWATAGTIERRIEHAIEAEVALLKERYADAGLSGLLAAVRVRVTDDPDGNTIYLVTDARHRTLAGNLLNWQPPEKLREGWFEIELAHEDDTSAARLFNHVLPNGGHLIVGQDMADRIELQGLIVNALLWAGALTLLFGAGGAILFRHLMRRGVDAVRRTAGAIIDGDLSQRVPLTGTGDELDLLGETVNRMLDQIQRLMEGVRQVSNAIAHDLRTPLTRMRGRLEVLLAEEMALPRRSAIEKALGEVDTLLQIFDALLRIAEVEAGARRSAFAPVDLAALLEDLAELYAPLAEEEGQSLALAIQGTPAVQADRHLVSQAVANLIENAIKYAGEGAKITLAARATDEGAEITLSDTGPGIAPEERAHVTERFYRGERSRGSPGSGLGLSLDQAVARLHGGSLTLEDNAPGLRAVVRLGTPRAG